MSAGDDAAPGDFFSPPERDLLPLSRVAGGLLDSGDGAAVACDFPGYEGQAEEREEPVGEKCVADADQGRFHSLNSGDPVTGFVSPESYKGFGGSIGGRRLASRRAFTYVSAR